MQTFADIAPAIERIDLRGTVVELRGIPVLRCFELIAEFPAILRWMSGKLDVAKLLNDVPNAAAALVAEGMRRGDDKALRESFHVDLVLGDQVKLLAGVLKATMPEGKDPFVQLAATLGLDLGAALNQTSDKASA